MFVGVAITTQFLLSLVWVTAGGTLAAFSYHGVVSSTDQTLVKPRACVAGEVAFGTHSIAAGEIPLGALRHARLVRAVVAVAFGAH